MSSNIAANLAGLTPGECFRLLARYRNKWLLPTLIGSLLSLGYAFTMTRYWEASQGLIVRPEVSASTTQDPGKFSDLYQMRTFQETILELGKSRQVLAATLKVVDELTDEPSFKEIEKARKHMSLLPPGGAEFGKTEVCYLQVKDTSRERALQLVAELGRQIDSRLHRLRSEKSKNLSEELEQQVALAQAALKAETGQLAEFETQVGADLGELRMLNASFSGQSDLRQQAVSLQDARRDAELEVRKAEQLLVVLRAAQEQPEQLIAMPNSLLESQPTLRRLKDGLVDAQLRAARLGGTRTADHPQVQAANTSVVTIRKDLHKELSVAIRGVEVDLQLNAGRSVQLEEQHQSVQQRLGRVAEMRADYANRTAAVENSRRTLDQTQQQLGEINATRVTAFGASLVMPIDQPESSLYPAGPGRASVVLLGTFCGFVFGLSWLFLTVAPVPTVDQAPETAVAMEPARNPGEAVPVMAFAVPTPRKIPSSLPPEVAAKISAIVASREMQVSSETCV